MPVSANSNRDRLHEREDWDDAAVVFVRFALIVIGWAYVFLFVQHLRDVFQFFHRREIKLAFIAAGLAAFRQERGRR